MKTYEYLFIFNISNFEIVRTRRSSYLPRRHKIFNDAYTIYWA